jgi:hypothetical protein
MTFMAWGSSRNRCAWPPDKPTLECGFGPEILCLSTISPHLETIFSSYSARYGGPTRIFDRLAIMMHILGIY